MNVGGTCDEWVKSKKITTSFFGSYLYAWKPFHEDV
jgi:hypothetical protein